MGRTESKEVANQGMQQSAEDQANAQEALSSTQSAVGNYTNQLNNFMRFGRQTYGANGEYMRDQNTLATGTAKAGSDQIAGNLALNAMRTGENTSGYAGTIANSRNQAEQQLTQQLAGADANRLQQLTAINQYGVQASALPAEVYSGIYGTSTGGSGSQLSSAANAAKTPGFWDTFAPALAGAAGAVGAGFAKSSGGGCWIAAAVYDGWDDPRTILVREWLNTEFTKKWMGRVVMAAYLKFGKRVAERVKRYGVLRRFFKPIFDLALNRATRQQESVGKR